MTELKPCATCKSELALKQLDNSYWKYWVVICENNNCIDISDLVVKGTKEEAIKLANGLWGLGRPEPCPFCKTVQPLESSYYPVAVEHYYITCINGKCCADGPMRDTLEAAIEAWNEAHRRD